jgi:ketosteroid isomerase-like protein
MPQITLTVTSDFVLIGLMKTKRIFAGCVLLLSLASVATISADTKSTLEQTLRDINAQWSATAASKDLEKTVSFYSDDAIVMPPNAPAEMNKEAILRGWKDFLDTASDISWKTTRVEIAQSGDLAVLTGTYDVTMKDGTKDHGKYCEVWEKQSDGKWKCGTDMFSSDLPSAPATSPAPGAAERK